MKTHLPVFRGPRRSGIGYLLILASVCLLQKCAVLSWHITSVTNDEYLSDPASFWIRSNPELVYRAETQTFHLLLTTPVPILCNVHHRPIIIETSGDNSTAATNVYDVATMPMSAPAEFHDVEVPFRDFDASDADGDDTKQYEIILTAILVGAYDDILQSMVYVAVADPLSPSLTIDDASAAKAIDSTVCPYEISVKEATSNSVEFQLSDQPPLPVTHSLAYSEVLEADQNDRRIIPIFPELARTEGITAAADPTLKISGLESDSSYNVIACFVDTLANVCCTPDPFDDTPLQIATASMEESSMLEQSQQESCYGDNVALLEEGATVSETSSNWGGGDMSSSFGGNKAIDDRSATSWSSFGDGDDAYIVIELPTSSSVAGVGIWSREMTNSAHILSFSLTLGGENCNVSSSLGPFDLPDTKQLYKYNLMDSMPASSECNEFRLDVETSTGGNTGLIAFEIYPVLETCLNDKQDEGSKNGGESEVKGEGDGRNSTDDETNATPDEEGSSMMMSDGSQASSSSSFSSSSFLNVQSLHAISAVSVAFFFVCLRV